MIDRPAAVPRAESGWPATPDICRPDGTSILCQKRTLQGFRGFVSPSGAFVVYDPMNRIR